MQRARGHSHSERNPLSIAISLFADYLRLFYKYACTASSAYQDNQYVVRTKSTQKSESTRVPEVGTHLLSYYTRKEKKKRKNCYSSETARKLHKSFAESHARKNDNTSQISSRKRERKSPHGRIYRVCITRSLQSGVLIKNPSFWSMSQLKCIFHLFKHILYTSFGSFYFFPWSFSTPEWLERPRT